MYDINSENASDYDFVLSDGTPVEFSKVTSKNNIQVRAPGYADGLPIFRRDGSHYKDNLDVTLSATPKVAEAPAPVAAPVVDKDLSGQVYIKDGKAFTLSLYNDVDPNQVVIGGRIYDLDLIGEVAQAA